MSGMALVYVHAVWMVVAVAIGTWSGYLGLVRATQRQRGGSPLPGRFNLRLHILTGTVYFVMLYAGIAFGWLMHEYILPAQVLVGWKGTLHLVLGFVIAGLYGGGWLIGGLLAKKPLPEARLWPRVHMILNFTACTLVGVQMAVAVWAVWLV